VGLDPATTDSISSLLRNLADQSSPRVLLSLRPQDPIPDWITHVVRLSGDKIAFSGEKEPFLTSIENTISTHQHSDLPQSSESPEGKVDNLTPRTPIALDGEPIIEMDGVHVQYGEKVVLGGWKQAVLDEENHKQGLQWQVRRGQRWAVLGANGSGKTTLLSVITSDHPQAYALPVRLFGRSRLPEPGRPAISIFDLQARMGHSSPEIHAFFPRQLTVRASIESAWADTFLAKPVLNYEIDTLVDRVLEYFQPELDPNFANAKDNVEGVDLSFMPVKFQKKVLSDDDPTAWQVDHSTQYAESTTFGQLSVAQQRLVLFIRAIIKKQDLIILDEAFSGMPAPMREKCFALLNSTAPPAANIAAEEESTPQLPYLGPEQALLVVSHLREEIPESVRFWMRLPSEVGDGEKLKFALGVVPDDMTLAEDQDAWKTIWSSNSLAPAKVESTAAQGVNDAEKYHYVTPSVE
jgi:ABC-type molybdenum transport system ATPase subunit/photorepair protein PhrA